MPSATLAALLALCVSMTTAADPTGDWKVIFQDNFTSPDIDTNLWNVANNYTHGSQEWQLYLSDEVYIEDGSLVLRTRVRDVMYGSKL